MRRVRISTWILTRGLPGHPGHLRARQARADGHRQQPLDGAALNLNLTGPDDVTANHHVYANDQVDANPEDRANEFSVPSRPTTPGRVAHGYAVRGGDADSLSHRFAALAGPPSRRRLVLVDVPLPGERRAQGRLRCIKLPPGPERHTVPSEHHSVPGYNVHIQVNIVHKTLG
jgi:hypothetical protein